MTISVFRRLTSWECRTCGRVTIQDEDPLSCTGRFGCGAYVSGYVASPPMTPAQYGASIPIDDKDIELNARDLEACDRAAGVVRRVPPPIPWENR